MLDVNLGCKTSEPVVCELKQRGTPFVTLSGYPREQHPTAFSGAGCIFAFFTIAGLPAEHVEGAIGSETFQHLAVAVDDQTWPISWGP